MARIEIRSFGVVSQDKGEAHGGIAIYGDDGKLIGEHHGLPKSFKTLKIFLNLSEHQREGGGFIGGQRYTRPDPVRPGRFLGTRHFGNTWFDTTDEVARAIDDALTRAGEAINAKRIRYSLLATGEKRNSGSVLAAYARVVAETVKRLTGARISVPDYVTDNSIWFLELSVTHDMTAVGNT